MFEETEGENAEIGDAEPRTGQDFPPNETDRAQRVSTDDHDGGSGNLDIEPPTLLTVDEIDQPADDDVPAAKPFDRNEILGLSTEYAQRIVTAVTVACACIFVFSQLHPNLIFSNTTPTGGDMGAHVWGPAFLRDELLPNLRLSGWTPDWYTGFPAFQFYMVIPSLAIVLLDVGFAPLIGIPAYIAALSGCGWFALRTSNYRLAAKMAIITLATAPLFLALPYNVAFKLVAVSGVVLMPAAAWALGHFGGLRFPGPALLSLASLAFAFDRSFNIYGGNIASTMAGEFAASISFSLSLVALGLVIRGTKTGQYRRLAALFIALTGLSHLLPAFFLLAAVAVVVIIRMVQGFFDDADRKITRFAALPWIIITGTFSALLSAFWVLPFFWRTSYLNDMGWERIEIVHSPLVTRSNLNPSDVLSDYPPLPVLLSLAAIGLIGSIIYRIELGWILAGTAAIMAAGFVYFPEGRLWNARILPFYYLSVALLAGIGVYVAVRALSRAHALVRAPIAVVSLGLLFVPAIDDAWVFPEPNDPGSYWWNAGLYVVRVLATFGVVVVILLEIPRQIGRIATPLWSCVGVAAIALLLLGPSRDLDVGGLGFNAELGRLVLGVAAFGVVCAVVISALRWLRPHFQSGGSIRPDDQAAPSVLIAAPIAATAVVFLLLGLALNAVGGIGQTDEGEREWSFAGVGFSSDDNSFVSGWARWNFSGLQGKPRVDGAAGDVGQGGYEEYEFVQRTMAGVGETHGCGRAFWEFAPELNRYGSTMTMMLLPHWTDGCITSMEGLFFEATPTVPYHFLLQTNLSAPGRDSNGTRVGGPSQAMRDLPYGTFDIDAGVRRLHELGVQYFLAFSPQTIREARDHPGLTEIASATPWVVFETSTSLVEPLGFEPVVIDGVRDHQDEWLDVGVEWFESLDVPRPASSGPEGWGSVASDVVTERYSSDENRKSGQISEGADPLASLLPSVQVADTATVTNVETDTDRISFNVDTPGVPILVKSSYFPNWVADGAEGPFRVAPNFMVVIPNETEVHLRFERSTVDWLGIIATVVGAIGLIATRQRWHFHARDV